MSKNQNSLTKHCPLAEAQCVGKIAAEGGINETEVLVEPLEKVSMGSVYFIS